MKLGKARVQSIGLFGKRPLILFQETCICVANSCPVPRPHMDSRRMLSSFLLPQSDTYDKGAPLCLGLNGLGTGKVMLQAGFLRLGKETHCAQTYESVVPTSHLEVAVLTGPLPEATTTCHGKLNFWIHSDYSWEGGAHKPSVE